MVSWGQPTTYASPTRPSEALELVELAENDDEVRAELQLALNELEGSNRT
jgi:hypothetical protein